MTLRQQIAKLRELLERVQRGPLEDPELMRVTLEIAIRRALEDLRREQERQKRRMRELHEFDYDDDEEED